MRRAAVLLILLVSSVAADPAEACSGAPASLLHHFPSDGERIGPNDAIAVHMVGELLDAIPEPVLADGDGHDLKVEFRRETHTAGVYSIVFFFHPVRPLVPGHYQLLVRYQSAGYGEPMELMGPLTRFEVVPSIERPSVSLSGSWDRVDFDEITGTSCGLYLQQIRLTLDTPPRVEEPLWFLVEIEGHPRPGVEPFATELALLIPAQTAGGIDTDPIRAEVTFETDCVTATPFSLGGPAGEPLRMCQPERCLSLLAAETDPFEPIDFAAAERCSPDLEDGLLLDAGAGCGCRSAGALSLEAWPTLLLLVLLRRRINRPVG